jgi:hypothetical protein
MYASAPDDEIQIQSLLSASCFGDHYTRTGIDLRTKEALTLAMLVSLGGCEPQAKGHVAANLNVGNGRDVLISVATQLLPFIGYPPHPVRAAPDRRGDAGPKEGSDMTPRPWLITGVGCGFGRELTE